MECGEIAPTVLFKKKKKTVKKGPKHLYGFPTSIKLFDIYYFGVIMCTRFWKII